MKININVLLASWSAVWSFYTVGFCLQKVGPAPFLISVFTQAFGTKTAVLNKAMFLLGIPLYFFAVWIVGCFLVLFIFRLIGKTA